MLCGRNNHRFEEEEEQHCVGGKERTVHRTHQGENPDGEVAVVVPEKPACNEFVAEMFAQLFAGRKFFADVRLFRRVKKFRVRFKV